MFLSNNNTDVLLFRRFVRQYGKVKLRRVLHAIEHNHSNKAIAHQLSLPLDDIQGIAQVYKRSA